ncbi:bifunctional folylpolyglutamate synthase/dihydrofolate synthase [Desulfomicrobium sp. ZS1]|jgi:dihydrofolate synthase/folylpolyglutamate synthase|uniref:bifunctional folylpolyglutamate synthase/dihydrofolate synthase n=1 Tax=Desulfomicrobium sp. ZS1 TaxID=2952228 RepID=UPI0020B28750|nr:cyanophycin synthetase [Desulfomicrobium sp. ZS1]UTF48981.1 bifunctional folylpolyglutamate synthase/dihydrofolate synthase [Desulfomicrobium sp. ZS1]
MTFASFAEFEVYLDSLGLFSMQLGLGRMQEAMRLMGLERRSATVAHVVGTNGKGSTSGFLEALARAHGLATGLYNSPHLVSVRERIRVRGSMVSEAGWLQAANAVMDRCAGVGLTYFELLTVMALFIFAREGLDLIVLEAGLGGTHDATCAISADLAVMTPVGLDHEHVLGPTLADIAHDKSGALGRCPAVTGEQDACVTDIFRQAGAGRPLWSLEDCRTAGGFLIPAGEAPMLLTSASLSGHPPYQLRNAALATLAWSRLALAGGWQFDAALCTQVLAVTRFSGRFCRHGRILVDGAHNPMGLTALCEALEAAGEHFNVLVFQAMRDKTLDQVILKRLRALADTVVIPALTLERAWDARELAGRFGHGARAVRDLQTALQGEGAILLCGSLYLVGAYYELFPEQLL